MRIHRQEIGRICILEMEGEVDSEHSIQLKRCLVKAREDAFKNFILDFKNVSFIDSTGLGILISLMRHLKEEGGKLRLSGLQDEVRSIFEITRLYRVFELSKTLEEALKEMQKRE